MITEKAVDEKGNRFWKIIVDPISYPVTVNEVKEFARIDGNDEDSILETFISAVTSGTESYLGRALVLRTYKMIMDEWNSKEIELPMPPLVSVSSIKTIDEDNIETIYDSSNYFTVIESIPGRIVIKKDSEVPTNTERYTAGYSIEWIAGYNVIPNQIKIAIMQWTTMLYENRSMTENEIGFGGKINTLQIPNEVKKILQPFRVINI
jgi:uncharacterized phiE125 gp8 family phage protein